MKLLDPFVFDKCIINMYSSSFETLHILILPVSKFNTTLKFLIYDTHALAYPRFNFYPTCTRKQINSPHSKPYTYGKPIYHPATATTRNTTRNEAENFSK